MYGIVLHPDLERLKVSFDLAEMARRGVSCWTNRRHLSKVMESCKRLEAPGRKLAKGMTWQLRDCRSC